MRISDWSSDVCSSDLLGEKGFRVVRFGNKAGNVVALSDPDLCPCIPEGADHNRTLRHVETSSDCPGFERPLSGSLPRSCLLGRSDTARPPYDGRKRAKLLKDLATPTGGNAVMAQPLSTASAGVKGASDLSSLSG